MSPTAGTGMGSTRIFSYINWLGPYLVQNFEFQYFWKFPKKFFLFFGRGGGFRRFCGYIWGHCKIGLFWGVHFYAFFFSSEYLWQVCTFESRLSLRHWTKTSRAGSNACFILFMRAKEEVYVESAHLLCLVWAFVTNGDWMPFCASSEGSGKSAHLHRLTLAFATVQNLVLP